MHELLPSGDKPDFPSITKLAITVQPVKENPPYLGNRSHTWG